MAILATTNILMAWIVPVAIIVIATLIGWVVERIVIRWVKSIATRKSHQRDSMLARALRGHITFWGFLLGVGLAYDTVTNIYNSLSNNPQEQHDTFGSFGVIFSPSNQALVHKTLLALFVISLTLMLARIAAVLIVASSATTARPVVSLVTNVTRFIVLMIGFLVVLSGVFEVNIAPWLATLGVAGLAASLALQATLTDFVSGMLLLASRQLIVGEYVKLSTGEEGYISDITWRTTTIRQLSNNMVIVPNSKMTSLPVTNFHIDTQNIGVSVELGVSYNSDLDHVERVTIEVAQDVMRTVQGGLPDFTPSVRFNTLGDYSIRLTVNMQAQHVGDQDLIKHEFIKRLRRRYLEDGISIPYPVQTVHLRDSQDASAAAGRDGLPDGKTEQATAERGPQASANSSDASSR